MTDEMIVLGSCKSCDGPAQLIDRDGVVEYRHISPSMDAFQSDVADLLRALGLGDHARPVSPHSVVADEIIPAIQRLRADLLTPEEAQDILNRNRPTSDFIAYEKRLRRLSSDSDTGDTE